MNLPAAFLTLARLRLAALASAKSTYPMPPLVDCTIWATPRLPLPPWVAVAQLIVSPRPSVHVGLAALSRNPLKLLVVPDPSERWATVMAVDGSDAPGLSAAIAGSFHVLT